MVFICKEEMLMIHRARVCYCPGEMFYKYVFLSMWKLDPWIELNWFLFYMHQIFLVMSQSLKQNHLHWWYSPLPTVQTSTVIADAPLGYDPPCQRVRLFYGGLGWEGRWHGYWGETGTGAWRTPAPSLADRLGHTRSHPLPDRWSSHSEPDEELYPDHRKLSTVDTKTHTHIKLVQRINANISAATPESTPSALLPYCEFSHVA